MDDIEAAARIISLSSEQPVSVFADGDGQYRLTTSRKDASEWEREGFALVSNFERGEKL